MSGKNTFCFIIFSSLKKFFKDLKEKKKMNREKPIATLFDFDGVVMDTEPQYSIFGANKDGNTIRKSTISN